MSDDQLTIDPTAAGAPPADADANTAAPAQSVQPGELKKPAATPGEPLDLNFILDIPLQLTVEVGRTRMLIQELLQLGKGSVVELNKMLGEPFEVLVNEKLVARGEIVIVNDHYGIRLTDIVSPNERVKSLA
ncbi:MAG: flagellar motor switch protein FliN [bacterium]|nr:flagellar motor switch protein FliN [bacterium]